MTPRRETSSFASRTLGNRSSTLGGGAAGLPVSLGQEKAHHVLGPAALAKLRWGRVDVALTRVSECAARGKLERRGDGVGASVEVIEHLRRNDQSAPGEQARWRGEAGMGESLRERSPR